SRPDREGSGMMNQKQVATIAGGLVIAFVLVLLAIFGSPVWFVLAALAAFGSIFLALSPWGRQ
ncbi:MAG: hypothetical protein ACPG7S_05380, partial [Miltoncostaeaceae bacterium]